MKKIINLSIQIVNFNTKSYLINCLQSVFRDLSNSKLLFEINILDNNSNDDLSDLKTFFSDFQKKSLKIYQSEKNLGFGGGHNYLAKNTKAKYLLLLNPDIVIEEKESIERLYNRMIDESSIKVIGPKLYNKQGRNQVFDHGENKGLLVKVLNELGLGFWKNREQETECAWVSGAAFLIEKSVFDKINGFDENFFLYKEEEDLCLRLKRLDHNYRVLYFPEVKIMHIGSVVAKKEIYFYKSWKYFLKKHPFGSRQV